MSRRQSSRRSRQKSRVGRLVGMILVIGILLIIFCFLGGYLWVTKYLRSEDFRKMVNERASAATGAEVTVSRLDWDGMLVKVPSVEVKGEELIQLVQIEGVETEVKLGSLFRRQVETSPVNIDYLGLRLETTKEAPQWKAPSGTFDFPGVVINECEGDVSFGGPRLLWKEVRVGIEGGQSAGSYELLCSGGEVETPVKLFPAGNLINLKARSNSGTLYLTEAEFGVYESGRLNLTGEVSFVDGQYSFVGNLRDVFGREMVPEDWKKRMEGTLSSDFVATGRGKSPPLVEGELQLVDGVLTSLPIFDHIAAYADTSRFRRLTLSEAELDFRQQGKQMELKNIVLASEGLMRIEGGLEIVERRLDGSFRLGLTPGTLARIPGAETHVFLPGKEGLVWSDVRITGTLDDPKEDLSSRLIAAAGRRMFELLPETGELVLKNSGRAASEVAVQLLEQAPGTASKAMEQGSEVIQKGGDLFSEGVGVALDLLPGFGLRERPPVPPTVPEEESVEEEDPTR